MQMIDMAEFFAFTLQHGWAPRMKMSIYNGKEYGCICGSVHVFDHAHVVRELPRMHAVIECDEGIGLTCVKIKGIFFTRLLAQYGALSPEHIRSADKHA